MSTYTLKLLRDTTLKPYTHAQDGIPLLKDHEYTATTAPQFKRGHYRVDIEGMEVGYIPYLDVSVLVGGRPLDVPPSIDSGTGEGILPVPFLYVEDNLSASYNHTAVAMVMAYLQVPRRDPTKRNLQYEDEVASVFTLMGWRDNNPQHIEAAFRYHGLSCTYSRHATIKQVADWLAKERPVLMEGLWDPWGTVAVVLGITQGGLVLNLPYLWTSTGPDYSKSGERETYPIAAIARTICPVDPEGLSAMGCYFIHKT